MTSCHFAIRLLCIQTFLALCSLGSPKMLSTPVPHWGGCVASLPTVAWVLWHFSAGSWKWRLIWLDRRSFWQPFALLVAWCFCLRQLKWTLQRGRAQVREQGLSLDDNPAHLRREKALHKSVSKRILEIQASLHPRWDSDDINHGLRIAQALITWGCFYLVGWEGAQQDFLL